MNSKIVVALAGNPNTGKTTIFNALTGAHQHIGNYPGVTVELKTGSRLHDGTNLQIVDLPGTYSLTAYSAEELVARNFIIDQKPDVVVDILDASNLERNLYLAVQLRELGIPLVLALNMSDTAESRGVVIESGLLSRYFKAIAVRMIGYKGVGTQELLDAIVLTATGKSPIAEAAAKAVSITASFNENHRSARERLIVDYGSAIDIEVSKIESVLNSNPTLNGHFDSRWLAIKLLENDSELIAGLSDSKVNSQLESSAAAIEQKLGEHPETIIAGRRYEFISRVCQDAVGATSDSRRTRSDAIDSIVTNRVLGIPIFLGLMYLVFQLTFTLGEPIMGGIEGFFHWLGGTIGSWWPPLSDSPLRSLLLDGVIGGVGGVLVFLPNIMLLFLSIALLEDSGYMARVAFIMDRVMNKIGLHGKSFIPMLIGFGCSVPAIMATRTLENRRDRLTTMLVIPLMSCGARLPIYALIIPAFFPKNWNAPMLWIIYVTGIILAVVGAKLLRSTVLKGDAFPL